MASLDSTKSVQSDAITRNYKQKLALKNLADGIGKHSTMTPVRAQESRRSETARERSEGSPEGEGENGSRVSGQR